MACKNPDFWNVSIVLFTAPALDFLLAYLPALSFRHLVCLLLSRDGARILTQMLCFRFYGWKALCSHQADDWGRVSELPFSFFFSLNQTKTRKALLSLSVCMCFYANLCPTLIWSFLYMFVKYMIGSNGGEKPIIGLRLPFANLVGVQLDQWAKAHTII